MKTLPEYINELVSLKWNTASRTDSFYTHIFLSVTKCYSDDFTHFTCKDKNYFSQNIPDIIKEMTSFYTLEEFQLYFKKTYRSNVFGFRFGNWDKLNDAGIPYIFYHFDSSFRGTIKEVKKIKLDEKEIIIICTEHVDEADTYYCVDPTNTNRLLTECFNSEVNLVLFVLFGNSLYTAVTKLYESTKEN